MQPCFGVSTIIHFGFIASSSKIRDLIKSNFSSSIIIDKSVETTIEFVLNEDTDNKDYLVKDEALDIIDQIAEEDTELEKKKKQLFVDSSELQTEEESLVETENIGEKGSIARDEKTNDGNLTVESFSDGESEIVSLTKDAYAYVQQEANNNYQPESLLEEANVAETESQESIELLKQELEKVLEKEFEVIKEEEEEVTKEEIFKEEVEALNRDDARDEVDALNRDDAKDEVEAIEESSSTNAYKRETKILNPEFERIIPVPLDLLPLKNNEQQDNKETETPKNQEYKKIEYKKVEHEKDLADLPVRERKKDSKRNH